MVQAVKDTYPGIKSYQIEAVIIARETGYSETIYGFKRLLPQINSGQRYNRSQDERRAQNTPIQGSAADIMKKCQNAMYEKIGIDSAFFNIAANHDYYDYTLSIWEGFDARTKELLAQRPFMKHGSTDIISQIHDEVIFEMDDDAELCRTMYEWIKNIMEMPPLPNFPVPMVAEGSFAYSWGNKVDAEKWLKEKVK